MNKKFSKLMAYLYMPLIFASICYIVLGVLLSPFYDIASSVLGIVVLNERMNYEQEYGSSYELTDIHDGIILLEDLTLPVYGDHYGQLSIDRFDFEAPVHYGDDYAILRVGAGQYAGSFFPGFGGTTLIAGHNTKVFRPLRYAEVGDTIKFSTSYGNFEYEIYDVRIVHQTEYHKYLDLMQTEREILLLYTCYPFDGLVGLATERWFVFAEKVSGPTVYRGE